MKDVVLSVVVPCYNESSIILETYSKISSYLQHIKLSYELIFCNDGSTDSTLDILKVISKNDSCVQVISSDKNRGLGYAMRLLFNHSKGKYIIQLDADLSTPVSIISKILNELQKNDVVIASRYLKHSRNKINFKRLFLSRVYNFLIRILFNLNLKDTQSGFVGFNRRVIDNIKFKSKRFDYHIEFMSRINSANYIIKEIPCLYVHRERDSKFNVVQDGFETLFSTFRIFWLLKNEKT